MKLLLLAAAAILSGCATTTTVVVRGDEIAGSAKLAASQGAGRSTSGGRTQTVGLPLSRKGKIGLWAGVAVFLAYLMDSDGEEDGGGSAAP